MWYTWKYYYNIIVYTAMVGLAATSLIYEKWFHINNYYIYQLVTTLIGSGIVHDIIDCYICCLYILFVCTIPKNKYSFISNILFYFECKLLNLCFSFSKQTTVKTTNSMAPLCLGSSCTNPDSFYIIWNKHTHRQQQNPTDRINKIIRTNKPDGAITQLILFI